MQPLSTITEAAPTGFRWSGMRNKTWEFIAQNPLGAAGALVLIVFIFVALAAPIIAPFSEERGDFLYMSGRLTASTSWAPTMQAETFSAE